MKKFFITPLLLCVLSTHAQQTVTFDANAPRIRDKFVKQEMEYFSPGQSGEDVVWEFSNLEVLKDYPIEYFSDSDSVLITALEPTMLRKYAVTSDTLKYVGYETALKNMDYERPIILLTYPFSYGDGISNPFIGNGIYCGTSSIRTIGSVSSEADAFGSILLSEEDTIRNVLRVHIVRSASVNMNALNDTTVFDPNNLKQEIEERYQWYARGYRYPLFETVSTTNYNNMEPVSCLQKAYSYLPDKQRLLNDPLNESITNRDSIAGQSRSDNTIINYKTYVNGSDITINYDLTEKATVTILVCNHMGFVYHHSSFTQSAGIGYTRDITCNGLPHGVYILYLNVNGKVYSEKVELK